MYQVAVLMSTYNGEKYVAGQIDSILAQKGVSIDLYIRDDGSADRTMDILEEYAKKHSNISIQKGDNIGVGNSFMSLVYTVHGNYEYFAFADQDDIWLESKIQTAIHSIEKTTSPALYVSNQTLVNKDLEVLGSRFSSAPSTEFRQILCRNKVSGCTMVWNRCLQDLLSNQVRRPSKQLLSNRIHDVWVAMAAAVTGEIIYDSDSYILYRQHQDNVVGVKKTNIIKQWMRKIVNTEEQNGRSKLARETVEAFEDCIQDADILSALKTYGFYQHDPVKKKQLLHDKSMVQYTGEKPGMFRLKVFLNLF